MSQMQTRHALVILGQTLNKHHCEPFCSNPASDLPAPLKHRCPSARSPAHSRGVQPGTPERQCRPGWQSSASFLSRGCSL